MPIAQYLMPDGRVAQFQVPDGTTPEQAKALIGQIDFSKLDSTPAPEIKTSPTSGGGPADIVKDTLESLKNTAAATGKAMAEPVNSPTANGVMAIPDAIVRGVAKVGNALGGVYGAATAPIAGALTASVENSGVIPAAAGAIKRNLVPTDPRFSANLTPEQQHEISTGVGTDLANAVMMGKGGQQGAEAAAARTAAGVPEPYDPIKQTIAPAIEKFEAASNSLPGVLGDTRSGSIAKPPITQEALRDASQNAYDFVEKSGTVLSPAVTDRALNVIDAAKQKPLFGGKVLTAEQAAINSALADYDAARGQPMTMQDLQGLDSTLGDKAAQAYVSGKANQGRIISGVQDKIREMVKPSNLDPSDISGTPEGISVLQNDAIPAWAAQAKMSDIGKIVERANMMDNPVTAVRTGLRNLILNKNKFNQYPANVQAMIIKGAKTGVVDDLLGIVGSRLNEIAAGAAGGAQGMAAAHVVSGTVRGIRAAARNAQADKIIAALAEPLRGTVERFGAGNYPPAPTVAPSVAPTASAPLALPSPKMVVDRYGIATTEANAQPLPDERGVTAPQSPTVPNQQAMEAARGKTAPAFNQQEAIKQAQIEQMWRDNTVPPETLINESAQRLKDAGLPIGQMGEVLLRLVANQAGSVSVPRFNALYNAAKAYAANPVFPSQPMAEQDRLRAIMDLPPAEAIAALNGYRRTQAR